MLQDILSRFKYLLTVFLFFAATLVQAATIDLNTATAQEIAAALSGIGLKKAQAIVAYRTEYGPFSSLDALTNVKGIGPKTLAKNQDLIKVSEPKSSAE